MALDLGLEVLGGRRSSEPERDVGAGIGQRQRDRPPEAARGARDQGGLPVRSKLG